MQWCSHQIVYEHGPVGQLQSMKSFWSLTLGETKSHIAAPSCSMTAIFICALMSADLFSWDKGAACAIVIRFISALWAMEARLYSRED